MLVNLSIKNVPQDTVEKLKERARRHHRSLQGELLAILEKLEEEMAPKPLSVDEAMALIKDTGLATGRESQKMIRQDRDAL